MKACYFHMCALRHIRSSLPDEVAKIVACSIISSRLDYCNSLLVEMSENNFAKLQSARVVTGTKRYDHVKREVVHITPVLAQLHWLPVQARVSFKLASLVYNIRQSNTPKYLASYLVGIKLPEISDTVRLERRAYSRSPQRNSKPRSELSATQLRSYGTVFQYLSETVRLLIVLERI